MSELEAQRVPGHAQRLRTLAERLKRGTIACPDAYVAIRTTALEEMGNECERLAWCLEVGNSEMYWPESVLGLTQAEEAAWRAAHPRA